MVDVFVPYSTFPPWPGATRAVSTLHLSLKLQGRTRWLIASSLLLAIRDGFLYRSSAKVLAIPFSVLLPHAAVLLLVAAVLLPVTAVLLPHAAVLLPHAAVLPPVTAVLATWALPFGRWLISLTV